MPKDQFSPEIKSVIRRQFILLAMTYTMCWLMSCYEWYFFWSFYLFIHSMSNIVVKTNTELPIRDLFGAFFCLQYLIGPALVYGVFADYQLETYKMKLTSDEYFSFTLPAILLFHIGLWIGEGKKGLVIDLEKVQNGLARVEKWAYSFLIIGFVASLATPFFPTSLGFVFYLLGGVKYCAVFMLMLGRSKVPKTVLVLVFGGLLLSAFTQVMFHDLLTWVLFLAIFAAVRYKFAFSTKLLGLSIFIVLVLFLQLVKIFLRQEIWKNNKEFSTEVLIDVTATASAEKKGIFSKESIAPNLVRINQGWIVTNVMTNVPRKVPHTNGDLMYMYFEAALLPRFIAPDKLRAGDPEIFIKYSGHMIDKGTSMGLSPMADGYVDFGWNGGIIFLGVYGLAYGLALRYYRRLSDKNALWLIFIPLIFIYPIRPDCETQTSFGHFVKASFLLWLLFTLFFKNAVEVNTAVTDKPED
ncbi:MAG: hypothetical protein V4616_06430 [Bacteroidota bacterium]